MPKKFDVCKPEKYQGKNGTEKTYWHNIGTVTVFTKNDGSRSTMLEIPAIGLKANIFERKEREQKPAQVERTDTNEDISPEDIPF